MKVNELIYFLSDVEFIFVELKYLFKTCLNIGLIQGHFGDIYIDSYLFKIFLQSIYLY